MNAKMQECFKPHVLMHSLFGLGLGLLVAHFWTASVVVTNVWVGVGVLVVAVVLDVARKS